MQRQVLPASPPALRAHLFWALEVACCLSARCCYLRCWWHEMRADQLCAAQRLTRPRRQRAAKGCLRRKYRHTQRSSYTIAATAQTARAPAAVLQSQVLHLEACEGANGHEGGVHGQYAAYEPKRRCASCPTLRKQMHWLRAGSGLDTRLHGRRRDVASNKPCPAAVLRLGTNIEKC